MIALSSETLRGAARTLRREGPSALVARLRLRSEADYAEWLKERDIVSVMVALQGLSERQLARIGMSRATLAIDVADLIRRAERETEVTRDVLELVGQRDRAGEGLMAAE